MNVLRRVTVIVLCITISALFLVSPAQAKTSCHKINAKGVGQDLGNGVTEAQIRGGGLLQGTTVGNFVITGFSGTVASIAGTVAFTTNKATLTVSVAGTFDVVSGAFNAAGPVTASSGKLAGASGDLVFDGVQDLVTGAFTETVDGQVCVDLSP